MKMIVLSLCLAGVASADPAPKCEAKGTPIFEIDRLEQGTPKSQQAAKVYPSGAWTFAQTLDDGKPGPTATGCLDGDVAKKLRAELADAKWKVAVARMHCMAISSSYTLYKVNGKAAFESHTCDGRSVDADTQKLIDDAEDALHVAFRHAKAAPLVPPQAP